MKKKKLKRKKKLKTRKKNKDIAKNIIILTRNRFLLLVHKWAHFLLLKMHNFNKLFKLCRPETPPPPPHFYYAQTHWFENQICIPITYTNTLSNSYI